MQALRKRKGVEKWNDQRDTKMFMRFLQANIFRRAKETGRKDEAACVVNVSQQRWDPEDRIDFRREPNRHLELDQRKTPRFARSFWGGRFGNEGKTRRDRAGRNLHFRPKKGRRTPVWTAYSRNAKRVIAFVIGWGLEAAKAIYRKVKSLRNNVVHFYSDANSCYVVAFKQLRIPEPHTMTKTETHLIESSNSSIRDNLARFTRKTKRFSKTYEMLAITLDLFLLSKTPALLSMLY